MGVVAGWVLGTTVAYAGGVHVDDSCGCLEPEVVELELRSAIGDEVVDRVDLRVKLEGTDHWRLELEVLDGSGSLWNRAVMVEPVDCPYLTALITQSVERGLADLPGWDLAFRRPATELGGVVSATFPWALRLGFGLDLWIPVGGAVHLQVQPDLVYGLVQEFEAGTAQLVGATLSAGPGVDLGVGSGAIRIATRFGAGATIVTGGGAAENFTERYPRAVATTDLGWAGGAGLRAAVRVEVPVARLRFDDEDGDPTDDPLEPLVRVGLVVGFSGPLRTSDVRRSDRR